MPVNLTPPDAQSLHAVAGLHLFYAQAGIKSPDRKDVLVIELDEGANVAGVFTQNDFCAAPVFVAKQHLASSAPRALIINSGNANAGTGAEGRARAVSVCAALGKLRGVAAEAVLPFSTGVILEPLPNDKIEAALEHLTPCDWLTAAEAIMTTDIVPKAASRTFTIQGKPITLSGIAKGSGMICPNMATLLAFVATDAKIEKNILNQWVKEASDQSFNAITVDGDTSTNDALMLMATGASGVEIGDDEDGKLFFAELLALTQTLAHAIVRDGEGATKFIAVQVEGGKTVEECRKVAYSIAHSPLIKTAFFASDPNLGRIVMAVGKAGVEQLDIEQLSIYLGDVRVVHGGGRDPNYCEADGQRVMNQEDITIRVVLNRGEAQATVWTCDFSYDYVKINAEYRS